MRQRVRSCRLLFLGGFWLCSAALAADAVPTLAPGEFARVGDVTIAAQDFDNAFREAGRQKFYHGKPPEGAVDALRREIGDRLINRVLLVQEARRRGLQPDQKKIQETIAGYDRQYGASEQWKKNREQMLPGLVQYLEVESLIEQMEKEARNAPAPSEADVRAFYDRRRDLFTEPEQVRVSLILLKVDPSSTAEVWEKTDREGQSIVKQLRDGADFGELAKKHSKDPSASTGGDLGYLHRGMLPDAAQQAVDGLKPGGISDPIVAIEGIAIVRLEDRKEARPRSFEDVKPRAAELLRRERGEESYRQFIAELRRSVPLAVDETRYPPAPAGDKSKESK